LTVVNVPFQETGEESPVEPPKLWEKPFFIDLVKNGLLGLAFIALLLLVIRPLMKMLPAPRTSRNDDFEPLSNGRERHEQLERGGTGTGGHGLLPQQELDFKGPAELLAIVKQDPYQTAQIIQNWLKQRE